MREEKKRDCCWSGPPRGPAFQSDWRRQPVVEEGEPQLEAREAAEKAVESAEDDWRSCGLAERKCGSCGMKGPCWDADDDGVKMMMRG